jgi:hypothetical protein
MSACFDPGGIKIHPITVVVEPFQPNDSSHINHINAVIPDGVIMNTKLELEFRTSLMDSQEGTEDSDSEDTVTEAKHSSISYTEGAVTGLNDRVEQLGELDQRGLKKSDRTPAEENPARKQTNANGQTDRKSLLQWGPRKPDPWDTGWKNLFPPNGRKIASQKNRQNDRMIGRLFAKRKSHLA